MTGSTGADAQIDHAIQALIADERLPDSYAATVRTYWRPMADAIAARRKVNERPILIGINGAQGSGKTTLCRFLELLLARAHGLSSCTVSLDDLYLGRAERQSLARDIHPLFATRGVPGTHDVPLGKGLLGALLAGKVPLTLPRFDKATDDRAPDQSGTNILHAPDVVLFEGWCVGAQAQDEAALTAPVNALEQDEDPDGHWRRAVNEALRGAYAGLFGKLDMLVMLMPPNFESVLANRRLQERKLRERLGDTDGAAVMSDAQVARFIQHYERITRHMFADMPDRADILVRLDEQQRVAAFSVQT